MTKERAGGSLKTAIYATCSILVLVCVFSMLVVRWNQTNMFRSFELSEQSERTSTAIREIDRDVQELKARSEKHLQTGAESEFDASQTLQKSLLAKIDDVKSQDDTGDIHETLELMKTSLKTFQDQLEQASKQRKLRTELVQRSLPESDRNFNLLFDELQRVLTSENKKVPNQLVDGVQAYLRARQSLQQYFINPRSSDFDDAIDSLGRARRLFAQLDLKTDTPEGQSVDVSTMLSSIDEELASFADRGSLAFQATRSYLFYANVVMAGEISEFTYYSNQLKKNVAFRQAENRQTQERTREQTRTISVVVSALAIGLAIILAGRLSLMILQPISSITNTFQSLSRGETVDLIPALDRDDEIGRMAQAAKVFSEKNAETRELLADSERLRQRLTEKASALQIVNEELDQFAYIASHDLKSPLRGISHLVTWVQEDCGDLLPEDSQQHLRLMHDRIDKMESLLSDVLDYSKVGRIQLQSEEVDLNELLASIITIVDVPDGFQIRAASRLPILQTLRTPLNQVLLNLIINAVKYNDKDSQGVIEVSATNEGGYYRFSVRDNGIGIDPRYHEKIFVMYQRLSSDQEGSGMGLAIVKKQITNLGGKIWVKSAAGEGATFVFTWPTEISPQQVPGMPSAQLD